VKKIQLKLAIFSQKSNERCNKLFIFIFILAFFGNFAVKKKRLSGTTTHLLFILLKKKQV